MEYNTHFSQTIDISVGQNRLKRVLLNFEIENKEIYNFD